MGYYNLKKMIHQSKDFAQQVQYFSTLVSKEAHLKSFYQELKECMPSR